MTGSPKWGTISWLIGDNIEMPCNLDKFSGFNAVFLYSHCTDNVCLKLSCLNRSMKLHKETKQAIDFIALVDVVAACLTHAHTKTLKWHLQIKASGVWQLILPVALELDSQASSGVFIPKHTSETHFFTLHKHG